MRAQTTGSALHDLLLKTPHLRDGLRLYRFTTARSPIEILAYDQDDAQHTAPTARYRHVLTMCTGDIRPDVTLSPRLIARLLAIRERAQPALPGAETVRETENPTPAYALPEQTPPAFALDGGTVPRAMLASLLIDDDTKEEN